MICYLVGKINVMREAITRTKIYHVFNAVGCLFFAEGDYTLSLQKGVY